MHSLTESLLKERVTFHRCGHRVVLRSYLSVGFAWSGRRCPSCKSKDTHPLPSRERQESVERFHTEVAAFRDAVLRQVRSLENEDRNLCSVEEITAADVERMVELLELIDQVRPVEDNILYELSTHRSQLISAIPKSLPRFINDLSLAALFAGARVTIGIVKKELAQFKRDRREMIEVDRPRVELEISLEKQIDHLYELVHPLKQLRANTARICIADMQKLTKLLEDYEKWSDDLRDIEDRWQSRLLAIEELLEGSDAPLEPLGGTEVSCSICFNDYISLNGKSEVAIALPCRHFFGEKCLRRWLLQNDTCPLCRASYEDDLSYLDDASDD